MVLSGEGQRITVVLPAYNEEAAIPALLGRLEAAFAQHSFKGEFLVVNDGSTDGTEAAVRRHRGRLGVRLLGFDSNQGLAAAIKAGLVAAAASSAPDDIIVTMDADNTHPPELIAAMTSAIGAGSDVVIASRYQPGSRTFGVSRRRRLISFIANVLFRLVVRIPGARDYTCGYRAYRAGVLQRAIAQYRDQLIQRRGFTCMAEILVRLKPLRPVVREMPLVLRYDLKPGASKMRIGRTMRETIVLLLRSALRIA
jgi:dolichol-phosphate mannosyltransferase